MNKFAKKIEKELQKQVYKLYGNSTSATCNLESMLFVFDSVSGKDIIVIKGVCGSEHSNYDFKIRCNEGDTIEMIKGMFTQYILDKMEKGESE